MINIYWVILIWQTILWENGKVRNDKILKNVVVYMAEVVAYHILTIWYHLFFSIEYQRFLRLLTAKETYIIIFFPKGHALPWASMIWCKYIPPFDSCVTLRMIHTIWIVENNFKFNSTKIVVQPAITKIDTNYLS